MAPCNANAGHIQPETGVRRRWVERFANPILGVPHEIPAMGLPRGFFHRAGTATVVNPAPALGRSSSLR
jgi:hypothetical protein